MYKSFNKAKGRTSRDRKPNNKKKNLRLTTASRWRRGIRRRLRATFDLLFLNFQFTFLHLWNFQHHRPSPQQGWRGGRWRSRRRQKNCCINKPRRAYERTHLCTCARLVSSVCSISAKFKIFHRLHRCGSPPRCERRARSQPQEIKSKEMTH